MADPHESPHLLMLKRGNDRVERWRAARELM
jgi:hypothetical protein